MFGGSQFSFGNSTTPNREYLKLFSLFFKCQYFFLAFGTQYTAVPQPTQSNTGFLFGASNPNTAVAPLNPTFSFGPGSTASQPFVNTLNTSSTVRPFGTTSTFGNLNPVSSSTVAPTSTGFSSGQLFGNATQQTSQPSALFGGSTAPAFGNAMVTPTLNIFGSTMTTSTNPQTGTTVKFEAFSGTDTMRGKNNLLTTINTKLQCITAMKEYLSKSMDELRYEDYQVNRKFAQQQSLFGSVNTLSTSGSATSTFNPSPFGMTPFGTNPSTSSTSAIFGGVTNVTTSTPFSFGTNTASTNIFGQPSATTTTNTQFGIPTSSTFGAPLASNSSMFGSGGTTNIFGNTTNTSMASPFNLKSQLTTSQPSFGFGTLTSSAPSFSFPTNTGTSIFSQPNTSFGSTTNIFGTTSNAPSAFGTTTSPFGSSTSAPNAFGTTTAAPVFSGFGSVGSTAPGTNSIFGSSMAAPTIFNFGPTANQSGTSTGLSFPSSNPTTNPFASNIFGQSQQPSLFNSVQSQSSIFNQPFQNTTTVPTFNFAASLTNSQQSQMMVNNNNNQLAAQQNQQALAIQQRFLAVSLLDPYASRGIKDYK
ncbi:unnamed protein product, partial [Didymodactylos carnosus]